MYIKPNQKQRGLGGRLKITPLPENIRGKKLVVVDDSIVRGTTTRQVVQMLREAGAAEVHFRVSSPPYKWPCSYGMDTGSRSELLAADMSVGEIRDFLGVDSLAYLELDRLTHATGASSDSFCTACLSGRYDTIGVDLVAMSVDDIAVQGAEPLFFLDYISIGKLVPEIVDDIVSGVAHGCVESGCALLGGEMSEHPDLMEPGEFDLVGFAVGVVER